MHGKIILSIIIISLLSISGYMYRNNQREGLNNLCQGDITTMDSTNNSIDVEYLRNTYPEEFGGSYFDAERNLNVNLVGDGKSIKELLKDKSVKYHTVKYSKKYLEEINNALCDKIQELGIILLMVDEPNNKVVIYLNNPEDTTAISNIKRIVDSPAIEYKKEKIKIEAST